MMIIDILLAIIGLCSGFVVASGVFAFIAIVGVLPKVIHKTNTVKYTTFYENFIIMGGILGNLVAVYDYSLPISLPAWFIGIVGLIGGMFIGCVIVSLAETLDAIPILTRRIQLFSGLSVIILIFAVGKTVGSLIYFYIFGY